ncbi:oligosaccharide flippase family protein [Anaeromyxobacter diazotrophicus]|uniref:Polysaccharide biosynthesis protein n=1 Tax=Anaeromyxobacter diazotrophicus TaxID=2590199 RepID=A0A7I9VP17_9BACT|nr:oligosaccharide flippase family protein [Anaeromyxobacter diazotrophicus]GEJ58161.1 hypothetical protein AMYX_29020 [Anaeromyxobacter diazotrophicus]
MIAPVLSYVARERERILPAGSLRNRFASGLLWSLVSAVGSRGLNVAASLVCARLMGRAVYGEYGMVQSTVGMLGSFSVLGLGITATRYVAEYRDKDPEKVARVLRMSSLASGASGVLMTAALLAFAPLIAGRVLASPRLATPLMLGAAMVALNALVAFQNGVLAGFEAFRPMARISLVSGLTSFPLIAIGAWQRGLEGAVVGTVASLLVNLVLNQRSLREQYARAGIRPRAPDWRREASVFWSFALPAFLASFAVTPALWACNALLANTPGGYAELGVYTAAERWRLALLFVPMTVFRMVFPMMSNLRGAADTVRYARLNRANLVVTLVLVTVPALAVGLLARPAMAAFGTGFAAGWPVLVILTASTIPEALNTVFGYPLVVGHRMWTRFGFDVVLGVTVVALGSLLIPRWGAAGLAVAYAAAFTATAAGLFAFTSFHRRALLPGEPAAAPAVPPGAAEQQRG